MSRLRKPEDDEKLINRLDLISPLGEGGIGANFEEWDHLLELGKALNTILAAEYF